MNPTVIVIVPDTVLRNHLGCDDNDWANTPRIDAFAEKAVAFDRMYFAD